MGIDEKNMNDLNLKGVPEPYALQVTDNSMEPEFLIVLIDPSKFI